MPGAEVMSETLKRSPKAAQEIWAGAYDGAVDLYGEGERARWMAFATLRRTFRHVGDRWEPRSMRTIQPPKKARERASRCPRGDRCSPELLYLAERLGIEHARTRNRRDVAEAIRVRLGLRAPSAERSAGTRETVPAG